MLRPPNGSAVTVGLLGPVEIRVAGRPVAVKGPRRQALIAALAAALPGGVGRDRLVEVLWGDDLPRDPDHALDSLVSQVRKVLAGAGADPSTVARTVDGYRLDVAADAVDADRFRRFVGEARAARAAGDAGRAAQRYTQALTLWRGEALEGIDIPFLRPGAEQLAHLRRDAVEERLSAELDLGRHGEVLAELRSQVAAHPFREGLWRLLLLALYRSGRQAEALEAYELARSKLVAELGLDPSPELADLHARILRQEAALGVAPAMPGNLPAPLDRLTGRDDAIDAAGAAVGRHRLVTLLGLGGVGKTRLAVEAARTAAGRFRGGAWLIELAPLTDQSRVDVALAAALGVREWAGEDLLEEIARRLSFQPTLLVLDNCEHVLQQAAAVTRRLLERCPHVSVLATSRLPLNLPGEAPIAVEPLPVAAAGGSGSAVDLFCERASRACGVPPDRFDIGKVEKLCGLLGGLPLAVELAAAQLRLLDLDELTERLIRGRLPLVSGDPTAPARHRSLDACLEWSYRLLDLSQQRLLAWISVFRGGFSLAALEIIAGRVDPELDTVTALRGVVEASLVNPTPEGRYRVHATVRAFAAERLAAGPEGQAVHAAHARWTLATVVECLASPGTADAQPPFERLLPEHGNLRAAMRWALDRGPADLGLELAGRLATVWFDSGFIDEAIQWVEEALHAEDSPPSSRLHPLQVGCELALRRRDYALLDRWLRELRETAAALGSAAAMGRAAHAEGHLAWRVGDIERARLLFSDAADRQAAAGCSDSDLPLRFAMLLEAESGDLDRVRSLEGAVAGHVAGTSGGRGRVAVVVAPWKPSITAAAHSSAAFVRGDLGAARRRLGEILTGVHPAPPYMLPGHYAFLSQLEVFAGDLDAARAAATMALAGGRAMNTLEAEVLAQTTLGLVALDGDDLATARSRLRDALECCVAIREATMLPGVLLAVAELASVRRERGRARTLVAGALAEYGRMGFPLPTPWRNRLTARHPELLEGHPPTGRLPLADVVAAARVVTTETDAVNIPDAAPNVRPGAARRLPPPAG